MCLLKFHRSDDYSELSYLSLLTCDVLIISRDSYPEDMVFQEEEESNFQNLRLVVLEG